MVIEPQASAPVERPQPSLETLSPLQMLNVLKRVAKGWLTRFRQYDKEADFKLGQIQNTVARELGWEDWRLLLKAFHQDEQQWLRRILDLLPKRGMLQMEVIEVAPVKWHQAEVEAEVERFALTHCAVSNELDGIASKYGDAGDAISLEDFLVDHLTGRYPLRMVYKVLNRLQIDGPWVLRVEPATPPSLVFTKIRWVYPGIGLI